MDTNSKKTIESGEPLLLRRTLVGSLRRASPFAHSSVASGGTFFRSAPAYTAKVTPVSTRSGLVPSSDHAKTPQLDRTTDIFSVGKIQINQQLICEQILVSRNNEHTKLVLFDFPAAVRKRIYDFCFHEESRKISLSPRFATKAVFPDGYFASPWDVLEPVFGGLRACPPLRNELMIYFWTQYHFHVTLSPFTGPAFSPLSSVWLPRYIDIVQYLSVEADLTRFGFDNALVRANFGHNVNKTEVLLIGILKGLASRGGKTTIAELNVMCRKYTGYRPNGTRPIDWEPVPYCPDESLYFSDALVNLRGFIQKLRMSGFSQKYSEKVLQTIFNEEVYEPILLPSTDCAWPPTFDGTPNSASNENLMAIMSPSPGKFEQLHDTPSSNFSDEIEKEMLKYESSMSSEKTHAENVSLTGGNVIATSDTSETLVDTQAYQDCIGSFTSSNDSVWSETQVRGSNPNNGRQILTAAGPLTTESPSATPKSIESKNTEGEDFQVRLLDNESLKHLLSATTSRETPNFILQSLSDSGDHLETTSTVDPRASTPQSPNTMNRMNEQDPAFMRTIDALRLLDEDEKPKLIRKARPASMIPSPIRNTEQTNRTPRSQTSLGTHPRPEGTVRRYLSFVKKFRGEER